MDTPQIDLARLTAAHALAVQTYEDAVAARNSGGRTDAATVKLDDHVQACRADVEAISVAIDVAIEERGAIPADVPSQTILPTGPVTMFRDTDITSRVPDATEGARHTVKRGRNKKGATAVVVHRGRATVQGSTDWDVERLAATTGQRVADVVAILASHKLSHVDALTLGAAALDVERAADQILNALDVPAMMGTDAVAWQSIDSADRIDYPADADAMTVAILAGELTDSLVALSRHRSGLCGYLPDVDVSFVTAANTTDIRDRRAPADSAWRDHGLTVEQITPRRVTLSELADVAAPTVETASWPNSGPRSARPRIPSLRKSEVDYPTRGLIGQSTRARGKYLPMCQREDHPWQHGSDAYCHECEHHDAVNVAAERIHIGNETFDRGSKMNATSGTPRPTTRRERMERAAAATARVDAIPTLDHATDDAIRDAVAALEPGEAVRFIGHDGNVGNVKRAASGRYTVRTDATRIGSPRNVDTAAQLAVTAFGN